MRWKYCGTPCRGAYHLFDIDPGAALHFIPLAPGYLPWLFQSQILFSPYVGAYGLYATAHIRRLNLLILFAMELQYS